MKFVEAFIALMAVAAGLIFIVFNFVTHWILEIVMLTGAGIIIALDIFALLVWFVNWKYYPEQK